MWRPAGSNDALADADATDRSDMFPGPSTPPSSPLPKRLRVRLEESKEKHGAHADLDARMRVALRIQVRARRATRPHLFLFLRHPRQPRLPRYCAGGPFSTHATALPRQNKTQPHRRRRSLAAETQRSELERTRERARVLNARVARAADSRRSRSQALAATTQRRLETARKNRDRLVARVAAKAARRNELAARTAANAAAVAETVKAAVADRAVPRDDWYAKRFAAQRAAAAIQRAWRRYFSRRRTCSPERQNQIDWPSPLASAAAAFAALGLTRRSERHRLGDFDRFAAALERRETRSAADALVSAVRTRAAEARPPMAFDAGGAPSCRKLLCAFIIRAHPAVVLGREGAPDADEPDAGASGSASLEGALEAAAAALVASLEALVSAAIDEALPPEVVDAATRSSDPNAPTRSGPNASGPLAPTRPLAPPGSGSLVDPVGDATRVFLDAWRLYSDRFARWKSSDASALVRDLTRAAVALETSASRVAGSPSRRALNPPGSDEAAVRAACDEDVAKLREKVVALAGESEARTFDEAVASAALRAEILETDAEATTRGVDDAANDAANDAENDAADVFFERRRAAREARRVETRGAIREARRANAAARRTRRSDAAAGERDETLFDEFVAHELMIDPCWRLDAVRPSDASAAASDASASGAASSWDAIASDLASGRLSSALAVVAKTRRSLEAFAAGVPEGKAPPDVDAALKATLAAFAPDEAPRFLARVATDPEDAEAALGGTMRDACAALRWLGAPAREEEAKARFDAFLLNTSSEAKNASSEAMNASSEAKNTSEASQPPLVRDPTRAAAAASASASAASSRVAASVAASLRFLTGECETTSRDCANAALASTARLSRADDGAALAAWARDRFARRRLNVLPDARGLAVADPRAVAAALPRTAAWLADAVPAAHALDAAAPPNANASPRRGADPRRAAGGTNPSGDATSADETPTFSSQDAPKTPLAPRAGSFPTEMRAGMSSNPNAPRAGWADPPTALDARRDAARNDSAWRGVSSAATPEGTFRVALARLLDAELQAPSSSESDPLAFARLLPETLEFDATRVRDATRAFDRLATLAACLRAAFGTRATRMAHYDAAVPSLAERIRAILKQSQLEEDEEDERRAETEGDRTTFHRAARDDRRLLASLEAEIAAASRAAASDRSSRIVRLDSDRAALRDALAARLVLGPDARDAAAAAFVASPLLRAGFRGAVGVALARDVAALAREVMRGVGRVTWAVHAPVYERLGEMFLSERDEI